MKAGPRTLVIINPKAAEAGRSLPIIEKALKESGIAFDRHVTTHAGDATNATRAALRASYDVVAVVGGDGTLSEAAAGFFAEDGRDIGVDVAVPIRREAALAVLPTGTGDDFARGLKEGRKPLEDWIAALVDHCRRPDGSRLRVIDVIQGNATPRENNSNGRSFVCLNVVTIGLGAEVAGRVAAQGSLMQRLSGEARFVAAAFGALAAWRERPVRVKVENAEAIECNSNLLAVANGIYAGGGMMFAPAARLDDGLLDVLVSCKITRAAILRELPRIRRGTHVSNPNVSTIQGTSVQVETFGAKDALPVEADGNVRGVTPAEFRIIPRALSVIV